MQEQRELRVQGTEPEQLLAALKEEVCGLTPQVREILSRTIAMQVNNQRALRDHLIEMSKMLLVLDEQNRSLQKLMYSKITVTAAQARMLTREIAAHAKSLCQRYRLQYREVGRRFRNAISREVLRAYSVTAMADLPAAQFDAAWHMVTQWDSYRLARELREKAAGGAAHA